MATNQEKLDLLRQKLDTIKLGGGQKRIDQQHGKGKYTARERLAKLFDEGSFNEIGQFIHHRCTNFGMEKKDIPGDGVVTGYGTVNGRMVFAYAEDFTVEGGSLGEMHAHKICQVQEMALKMGAPIIGINDSGGARIQEGIDALSGFGSIFMNNTKASGVIPQISVIMGPCAGGAVYSPALTDFVFMVKNTSDMFITGPAVIKSVTAEEVTSEELGGAVTHSTVSGVAHFACENEDDCIDKIKALLDFLPSNNMEETPFTESDDDPNREDDSLNTIVPDNSNIPYDMTDVIKSCVDHGEIFQVLEDYALNAITCFARMDGQTVGIIANQPKFLAGCLDINASDKTARFIRFCDAFNIPLVTFVDVPGFLPGTTQEFGGIIRHGAKMLYAYCEATVPKVTVVVRKAYGGAYIAMCCRQLGADMVFAWPSAEIAVMGADGAANIIFKHDEDKEQKKQEYIKEFQTPYKAAEHGYVDCVIEPKETRPRIINALAMLYSKREERPSKKHGNIPL
ncbi:MAG: methylmalonyl-CoA carboxyltransferase [Megasphaera sp.]|jgi:acetyl-CoA carboxylase carboxyltransferase component|nr:methylmalonyl-CoA carboxyltransferase [Megasphaera sp.]MCH4187413.1 methylmalonyl-CoA carboxyltransferase [Megasphaera sp.]MCH4217332.1 methylmalonyl-CoA carboxyltransferase [Megasphaera sp.]